MSPADRGRTHLADTAQLSPLAATAAQLAAGQPWEAGLLTQLLAELTRGAPNQPALRAALNELLGTGLPRIVHLVDGLTVGRVIPGCHKVGIPRLLDQGHHARARHSAAG